MQSKISAGYAKLDYGWLNCSTDPRKTVAIFSMQEQRVDTRAWKKLRGMGETDVCRSCEAKETVQHLLSGCNKLSATEYL